MRAVVPVLCLAGLVACGVDGAVSGEAQLLVPDDVSLHWDDSFNRTDDGLALLLPVDVMVYDGGSGDPMEAVALELHGAVPGALLVPPEAVTLVGFEESADAVWWDAWRDRYFELSPRSAPSSHLVVETDATGLARVYVFVDRFGVDEADGGFLPAQVTVTMGQAEESFLLVPR